MREVGRPSAVEMEFEFLQVLPMHECKHLIGETCNLLNSEWPRSKTARLQTLFMSCEKFPTSLVLVMNDFYVVGHVKLSEITLKGPDIMVESVIISKEHRGKGWGKMLMEDAEEYVRRRGKKMLYLSTKGQEGFYEKLGYEVCKPILYYGVALETSSDGGIKVNGVQPVVNVGSTLSDHSFRNGIRNGDPVRNGVSVEIAVSECDPVNGGPPPPPPPPMPVNNGKSQTIFRDIKSSKTYMRKSVTTSGHQNFAWKLSS